MADEIIDYNEEELMTKLRAKRRFRGLLIAINFVLLGYLIYQIGSSIANLVKSAKKVEGIVAILDKSQKESLGIYDQYVKEDKVLDCDFAIYGEKIYFTKDVFNKSDLKPVDDVQILKMETDSDNTIFREALHYDNVETSLDSGISLLYDKQNKPLEQGDYLFYSDYVSTQDFGNVLRVKNQLDMQYEIYSKPLENDMRIKTTIYAYKHNPALVMNVEYVTVLPDNYYDAIIIGDEDKATIWKNEHFKDLQVLIKNEMSEKEMFEVHTSEIYKIVDDVEDNQEHIIYSSSLLNDGYQNSDNRFIIQNYGYVNNDGYMSEFNNEHYAGKKAYIIEW